MSLTSTTRRFQLLQSVEVTFVGAPAEGDFLALFSLVEGCGLKPPKGPKPEDDAAARNAETRVKIGAPAETESDAPAKTETDSASSDT